MEPFTEHAGVAAPLLLDDINTDQITPAATFRSLHPDYGAAWFSRWRFNPNGTEIDSFVLNRPQFRSASILVAGRNFGCGSSREGAVWAMARHGIRCIIARSFAEFYRANCIQNGILPIVLSDNADDFETSVKRVDGNGKFKVDLANQLILAPDGRRFLFEISPADRAMLLNGQDDVDLGLQYVEDIDRWEKAMTIDQEWLQKISEREVESHHGGARAR
jgi:3-isopropylmalate/(R)-2-methylmalate dehydratase small subunit